MWLGLWKDVPEDEIPIRHITNGVHLRTWVSRDMAQLYDRYLGYRWQDEPAEAVAWQRVEQIPPSELWRTHERRRERLVAFARRRLRDQLIQRGAYPAAIQVANEVLDPEALTIGFARRFATYKRATLLFRDTERLAKILNHPQCPVQLIIAGKAHPQDQPGKELIQKIIQFTKEDTFRRRVVFLEDYDVNVARYLVQGSDVWLNTPLRLLEASGTSGMKAAANGGLNVSTLDGWWDEAYQPNAGWAIGRGENYQDLEYQVQIEAEALYELLEQDIVPAFYHRGEDKIPYRWIARMKASIRDLSSRFNTHRMVIEYTTKFYQPASACYQTMIADDFARARALAAWLNKLQQNWPQVWVEVVNLEYKGEIEVGEKFNAYARVSLGQLSPQDVRVELFLGAVSAEGEIIHPRIIPMQLFKMEKEGVYLFIASSVDCAESGLRGYTVRVLPDHPDLTTPFLPGIISWAKE